MRPRCRATTVAPQGPRDRSDCKATRSSSSSVHGGHHHSRRQLVPPLRGPRAVGSLLPLRAVRGGPHPVGVAPADAHLALVTVSSPSPVPSTTVVVEFLEDLSSPGLQCRVVGRDRRPPRGPATHHLDGASVGAACRDLQVPARCSRAPSSYPADLAPTCAASRSCLRCPVGLAHRRGRRVGLRSARCSSRSEAPPRATSSLVRRPKVAWQALGEPRIGASASARGFASVARSSSSRML